MSLTTVDYAVRTNEDWRDSLELTTGEGEDAEPVDLTGSSFIAHIRPYPEALHTVLVASTANGRLTVADPASAGVVAWNVAEALMSEIAPGIYVYDMLWTDANGATDVFVTGQITVERGITRL